jgi:FkbM family methyltransferase
VRLPYPVRAAAASILRSVPVRVRSGPNAGLRWTLASAGRGCRAGTFERDRLAALVSLTRPGDHVWDLGAHKGYVSLALSRRVGPGGSVSAVEPSLQNLWFLRRHVSWNDVDNVRVVRAAVADRDGEERFGGRGSTVQFHLGEGDETVRVARLSTLRDLDGLPPPDLIKMDIEGAEAATLRDGGDVLGDDCVLFVSLHSRGLYEECRTLLVERGFRAFESAPLARLSRNPGLEWAEDPELLAVGPARSIDTAEIETMNLFARR